MESFEPVLLSLQPEKMTPQMQMSVANALLQANEVAEAVKWATSSNLVGAPCAEQLPFANFENPRAFRPCDLQVGVWVGMCMIETEERFLLL